MGEQLLLPPRRHRAVGQHQHGNGAGQQGIEGAAAEFREGGQGTVEIKEIADQRCIGALLGAGQQPDRAAAEALIQQRHGGGTLLVLNLQPHHLIADFQR